MGYFDNLIRPAYVQYETQKEETNLNFENEASAEHRELAHQDLTAAKVLFKASKANATSDRRMKKALNRKAKQTAMESTEHSQKAIIFADDRHQNIKNPELHAKLEKTHNNSFMQREQEKAGINIVDKNDIQKLNSSIQRKNGEKSPYNGVRFYNQELDDDSVQEAIEVAEKAVNNLEEKVNQDKVQTVHIGNTVVNFTL